MRYMLLIYGDEQARATMSPADLETEMAAWYKYTADLQQAGKMRGGEALQPTTTATTVRGAERRTLVSDGPFAETKEQLGGFYIVEAADLDDAIAWASRMPNIPQGGAVEVRPIMELNAAPDRA